MSPEKQEDLQATLSRICRKYTAPVFLHDYFLASGHNEKTPNGTVTFVRFRGHHFACTCRHVLAEKDDKAVMGTAVRNPTAALMLGNAVINFSSFTVEGLRSSFSSPPSGGDYEIDVSIASCDLYWGAPNVAQEKEAIDLDSWREPPWEEIKYCAAAGYANEGKWMEADKVVTPMPLAIAEVISRISGDSREFTLHSSLGEPHGIYFSGMSGGPILAVLGETEFLPIGLIFEGYPSSSAVPESVFAGPKDIFIRGLTLSPTRFQSWLQKDLPAPRPYP